MPCGMWISDAPKATLSEMDFFDFVSGRREPPERCLASWPRAAAFLLAYGLQ
jgi:hypothetical protein